jgi:hypothetical protein
MQMLIPKHWLLMAMWPMFRSLHQSPISVFQIHKKSRDFKPMEPIVKGMVVDVKKYYNPIGTMLKNWH